MYINFGLIMLIIINDYRRIYVFLFYAINVVKYIIEQTITRIFQNHLKLVIKFILKVT